MRDQIWLKHFQGLRTTCRYDILMELSESGTWSEFALGENPNEIQAMIQEAVKAGTSPNKNEKDPRILLISRLNYEIKNPGSDPEMAFILRAAAGDLEAVQTFKLEFLHAGQAPPIHDAAVVAVLLGRIPVLQFCLQYKIQLDDEITKAVYHTYTADVLEVLFPLNIFDIKSRPEYLTPLLDHAITYGFFDRRFQGKPKNNPGGPSLARFLIKQGATVTTDILYQAIEIQTPQFVQSLLKGCSLEVMDDGAIHKATAKGQLEIVLMLLDKGVDVNKESNYAFLAHYVERTESVPVPGYALHYAVFMNQLELAKLLLARGADPRLRMESGPDAFMLAEDLQYHGDIMRALLADAVPGLPVLQ